MEDTHVGTCRRKRWKGGDKEMEGRIEDRQKGEREEGRDKEKEGGESLT